MKIIICSLVFTFSFQLLAAQNARVKIVRGNATKLLPGKVKATQIKKGDLLPEDTSIVTSAKSFVRVVFQDKSSMNVGPKSMVVINKLPKKKANMVNLLTGIIKAEVKKKSKKTTKTKMLIKTQTAVMGVRGTKFQSTYNPVNKTTSLVTVEGKVAMVKVKELPKAVKVPVKEAADSGSKIAEAKKVEVLDEVDQLDKVFSESKDVVEVPAGRYSGVVEKVAKPTVPVKIAPKQYNAIAKSMGSKKKAVEVMKASDSDPAPEGFENKATGEFAPKAGGIVDFNTGIYVAPAVNAKLDEKTGTFDSKVIGKVDKKTGDYIPPKGIKIDEKKGFVIDKKESKEIASNQDEVKLQKTVAMLNNDVKKQIVVNKVENKPSKSFISKWLPKNHILTAQLKPYSEVLTVKNNESGSEAEFYTEKANWMILTWKQDWNDKWSSRLRVGGQDYKIDESDVNVFKSSDDNGDNYFSMGVAYKYSEKMSILVDIVDRSEFYVVPSNQNGNDGVELRTQSVNSLDVGIEYFIRDWKKFKVSTTGTLHLMGDESIPSVFGGEEDADLFGFSVSGDLYYSWKKNLGLNSSLWFNRSNADGDSIEYTRSAFGLGFDFVWDV